MGIYAIILLLYSHINVSGLIITFTEQLSVVLDSDWSTAALSGEMFLYNDH